MTFTRRISEIIHGRFHAVWCNDYDAREVALEDDGDLYELISEESVPFSQVEEGIQDAILYNTKDIPDNETVYVYHCRNEHGDIDWYVPDSWTE